MHNLLSAALITGGGSSDFFHSLFVLLIVELALGLVVWLVSIVPVIPAPIKSVLTWILYVLMVVALINFLLGLIGHPLVAW